MKVRRRRTRLAFPTASGRSIDRPSLDPRFRARIPWGRYDPEASGAARAGTCGHARSPVIARILLGVAAAIALGCSGHGGPDTASDGAAPSCPPTYADVPQYSRCSGHVSCDYDGQFNCQCMDRGNTLEWVCTVFNCICLSADAAAGTFPPASATSGCVNQTCNTDADCPSGQHCGQQVGLAGLGPQNVCSVGCEGDFSSGGAMASCPFGGTCEHIVP